MTTAKSGDFAVRAENLGKRYRLRHESPSGYRSLREELSNTIGRFFVAGRRAAGDRTEEDFWAVRNVTFELGRGEVLGLIGRNGAGKSTLLKLLSRITEPSEGRVRIRGRVASLLEVGTGFHPELTGRENIYLNGIILGMTRSEVSRRFDEIVAFAEVERFLDTPVKRYSSGMYLRLAFAVAAHLDPEILVVDEVLAVGDAEFQKKCLGKIQSVAEQESRSVVFVSHNMAAISALTSRAILVRDGQVDMIGPTADVVARYGESIPSGKAAFDGKSRGKHSRIERAVVLDDKGNEIEQYAPGAPLTIIVELETDGTSNISLELMLVDPAQFRLGLFSLWQFFGKAIPPRPGRYQVQIPLEPLWLAAGTYFMDVTTSIADVSWDHYLQRAIRMEVPFSNPYGRTWDFRQSLGYGSLALRTKQEPRLTPVGVAQTG